ncbi:MAG: MGMT family protein [Thermostichales cyanobacterium HHBFW_bins_127]
MIVALTSHKSQFNPVTFAGRVYAVVAAIPPGRVATYAQVARWAGYPGYARQVGHALYRLSHQPTPIPWHRVINSRGGISRSPHRQGSDQIQYQRLQAEGIPLSSIAGTIDLERFGWRAPTFAPTQTP